MLQFHAVIRTSEIQAQEEMDMSTLSSHSRPTCSQAAPGISIWRAYAAVTTAFLLVMSIVPRAVSAAPSSQDVMSPSGLRDTLNFLGQEHVYLASATLGDLLRGDTVAYDASLTRYRDNAGRFTEIIGSVYGADAESTFRQLWQAHYDGFLDYALGASKKDESVKVAAKAALDANRNDIGAFFASQNPYLRSADVAATLRENVNEMTGAIDAMADQNWGQAFSLTHLAAHQSAEIVDPIADAIAQQFPENMEGGVTGPASEMSAAFTRLMQEHVFLASMTTTALALDNMPKAMASMSSAESNTRELGALIGKTYNEEVGQQFVSLWNQHLNAYADYTRAELNGDKDSMESARQFLGGWVTNTSNLLTSANPFFSQSSVAGLLNDHVAMTLSGIDAQVARDWPAAYAGVQMGSHQSIDLANVIAGGIVDAFGEQSGAQILPPATPPESQPAPVQLPRR